MTDIIRCAYSEVAEFISLLSDMHRGKLPKELIEFFEREKDKDYLPVIDPDIPIKEQSLLRETLGIIAHLNLKYWCEDPKERTRLSNIHKTNEVLYRERLVHEWLDLAD